MNPVWGSVKAEADREVFSGGHRDAPAAEPDLLLMSDVTARPVDWLWRYWIPFDALTVLDGDPSRGKSTLAIDLAARVSRGWAMPPRGGGPGEPADVLLLSAEDDPETTIRPRLDAAGADPARVRLLNGIRVGREVRPPVLPDDIEFVLTRMVEYRPRLIVIDPLMAFIGGQYDAHRDQDIRRCLARVVAAARQFRCAILVIRHLNKLNGAAALYRGGGSIGIVGAARAALIVGRDPADPGRYVVAMNKTNLGPIPHSLAYRIESAGEHARVAWCGETELGPDDILWHGDAPDARRRPGRPDTQRDEAVAFLRDLLTPGPAAATHVRDLAEASRLAWRTVRRAADDLGVERYQTRDGWFWRLVLEEEPIPD